MDRRGGAAVIETIRMEDELFHYRVSRRYRQVANGCVGETGHDRCVGGSCEENIDDI